MSPIVKIICFATLEQLYEVLVGNSYSTGIGIIFSLLRSSNLTKVDFWFRSFVSDKKLSSYVSKQNSFRTQFFAT